MASQSTDMVDMPHTGLTYIRKDEGEETEEEKQRPLPGARIKRCDALGTGGIESLPPDSVDLLLVDPPYGMTSMTWDKNFDVEKMFENCERVLKPNANAIVFGYGRFTASCLSGRWAKRWKYNMVWSKTRVSGALNQKIMPGRAHEDIMVFRKKGVRGVYNTKMRTGFPPASGPKIKRSGTKKNRAIGVFGGNAEYKGHGSTERHPTSVLVANSTPTSGSLHPTQKPVPLLSYLIRMFSDIGDVVLDPTMGSGSTGIAALITRRTFIGFEASKKFYGVSTERFQKERRNRSSAPSQGVRKRKST